MGDVEEYREISIVIYSIKIFIINIGTLYIFLKLSCNKTNKVRNLFAAISMCIPSAIFVIMKNFVNPLNAIIFTIMILTIIFKRMENTLLGYTIVMTLLSLCLSNSFYFMAIAISSLPLLKVKNDVIIFTIINLIYFLYV